LAYLTAIVVGIFLFINMGVFDTFGQAADWLGTSLSVPEWGVSEALVTCPPITDPKDKIGLESPFLLHAL